jgi:hypothetical protein
VLIEGVVNDVPVPNDEPPEEAAYQFNVPALAVALRVTVPVPQREAGVVPLTVGIAFTVTFTVISAVAVPSLT